MRFILIYLPSIVSDFLFSNIANPAKNRDKFLPIVASIEREFPNDKDDILNHGCHCSSLSGNGPAGPDYLDEVDKLCKKWKMLRRCARIEGGACFYHASVKKQSFYRVYGDEDLNKVCQPGDLNGCEGAMCAIDSEMIIELEYYLSSNWGGKISDTSSCGPPIGGAADRCCGTAPNLKLFNSETQICTPSTQPGFPPTISPKPPPNCGDNGTCRTVYSLKSDDQKQVNDWIQKPEHDFDKTANENFINWVNSNHDMLQARNANDEEFMRWLDNQVSSPSNSTENSQHDLEDEITASVEEDFKMNKEPSIILDEEEDTYDFQLLDEQDENRISGQKKPVKAVLKSAPLKPKFITKSRKPMPKPKQWATYGWGKKNAIKKSHERAANKAKRIYNRERIGSSPEGIAHMQYQENLKNQLLEDLLNTKALKNKKGYIEKSYDAVKEDKNFLELSDKDKAMARIQANIEKKKRENIMKAIYELEKANAHWPNKDLNERPAIEIDDNDDLNEIRALVRKYELPESITVENYLKQSSENEDVEILAKQALQMIKDSELDFDDLGR